MGSISLLLPASASGAPIVSQQFFMPWGQVRGSGLTQTSFNYTGQRLDGTGLLYYHARYYDPALARFVSADSVVPDPNRPQAFNRYSYVLNNPIRYTDPTGHCSFDAAGNINKWDCTVEEFDAMSIAERTRWTEQFMKQTGCKNCYNNILGVLDFFKAEGLGQSGTWISMVDAGILQGISHGYGLFIGAMQKSMNWGASKWATFFNARFVQNVSRSTQRKLWGAAEQAATDYGVSYATQGINPKTGQQYGLKPTFQEAALLGDTQLYRDTVRSGVGDYWYGTWADPFYPGQRKLVFAMAVTMWNINFEPPESQRYNGFN